MTMFQSICIEAESDGLEVKCIVNAGEIVSFGVSPDCDVQVVADGIAPKHFLISESGGFWIIEALDEAFETLQNDTAISRTLLQNGDRIRAGSATFRILFLKPKKGKTHEAGAKANLVDVFFCTDRKLSKSDRMRPEFLISRPQSSVIDLF